MDGAVQISCGKRSGDGVLGVPSCGWLVAVAFDVVMLRLVQMYLCVLAGFLDCESGPQRCSLQSSRLEM